MKKLCEFKDVIKIVRITDGDRLYIFDYKTNFLVDRFSIVRNDLPVELMEFFGHLEIETRKKL